MANSIITRDLLQAILDQYSMDPGGTHGIDHWARVRENGRTLASATGASLAVVELFAVFHDSRRFNEGTDPEHGKRGAELARTLHGEVFDLGEAEMDLLIYACQWHTDGLMEGDITVRACWDADRLDLGRVFKTPDPQRLCTEAARQKDILDRAARRGMERVIPKLIETEWGLSRNYPRSLG